MNNNDMTPEQRRAFFEREGYWPMAPIRERRLSPKEVAVATARQLHLSLRSQMLRGWKAPIHWDVPPAFKYPGMIYEELGHEAFCQAVKEYYDGILQERCEKARRVHTKWAVRQILRTFETHVRGFRKQSISRRGGIHVTSSDVPTNPAKLIEEGRLMADLKQYLEAYGVREEHRPIVERFVRLQLAKIYGVKC